ncbi:uncharacterized protein B0P05DRAFT_529397 [Gilbertella persicaria]|uniref:uncharacterized protein n=1 Tax=Gilbertella persicaria TaxID=101096 RepID=UPI00221F720E|nr:uncharacterized protein B0P05DRAFT_529397 [Gilbertella persicaria]KAI8090113.1 hypothetical protein B0P05DRAFT_529397 [Gilbertella persicaria]
MIKTVANTTRSISPTRTFFRLPITIQNIDHARAIFKTLSSYGDMIEYKFMRCPETQVYLRYGFVVYKYSQDAHKAIADQFIRVNSDVFKAPFDIKIEKSVNRAHPTQ